MKIQIVRIADRGVASRERVHLTVLAPTTLSFYVLLKTRYANASSIHSGSITAFWFPPIPVTAGDTVIVYTGRGANSSRKDSAGRTTYFLYASVDRTLFNSQADCVVLFEGAEWATSVMGQ